MLETSTIFVVIVVGMVADVTLSSFEVWLWIIAYGVDVTQADDSP